ncbi:MAG: hypothetical protein V4524_01020 [Patescibacteria group bacterium]
MSPIVPANPMLKPTIPSKFVERIITSQTGEQYRVVFLVTLVNGEVKARVVGAQLISKVQLLEDKSYELRAKRYERNTAVLCLPGASAINLSPTSYLISPALRVSPFTSLLFFTSQPTRAPSFR